MLDLLDAVTAADGTAPVNEQTLLQLRHGSRTTAVHLLARNGSGALVGYAQLDAGDKASGGAAELTVHPAHRRRRVGSLLVAALLDKAAGSGAAGPDGLRLWAHGNHPGAVALAARFGFHPGRVLWQLRRSLPDPLPPFELPEGVRLRPFRVGYDEPAVVEVNNRAFAWHPEQGGWDIEQLRLRQAEPWFDSDGFLLAVSDSGSEPGRLLGFHWTKVHRGDGEQEPIGEVYVVAVDPGAQGRGLGTTLTLAGLAYLRDRGLGRVLLYVDADNTAAVSLYRRLGFTHWATDVSYYR